MEFSSFENLNTLYQFKPAARQRHPIVRDSMKRLSFSTTTLLKPDPGAVKCINPLSGASTGHIVPKLTVAIRDSNPEDIFSPLESNGSIDHRCYDTGTSFFVGEDELSFNESPSPDLPTNKIVHQKFLGKGVDTVVTKGLPGRCTRNYCLSRQQPLLNRSQTVECLRENDKGRSHLTQSPDGGRGFDGAKNLEEKRRTANYFEWYNPLDKTARGPSFGARAKEGGAGGSLDKADVAASRYNATPSPADSTSEIKRDFFQISRGSESCHSLLSKSRESKLSTSIEKLLALK